MALHTLESSHVLPQVQELSVCPRPDLRAKGGSEMVSSLQELVLFGTEAGFAHEQVLDP